MDPTGTSHERVYDDFTRPELDHRRWATARVRDQDGNVHLYSDDNARTRVGNGRMEITVNPFTRFHDTQPVRNNAKQLYLSTERIAVPPQKEVTFATEMAIETYRQVPFDLQDAYGTANLVDFDTGMVINVAATNDTVYAIVERLLLSGVTTEDECFVHRVVMDVDTGPGHRHQYAVRYRRDTGEAVWYVDGRRVYWATLPVPVEGFQVGMGLFSSRSLKRFSRAERERGQGASGLWGPWRISQRTV